MKTTPSTRFYFNVCVFAFFVLVGFIKDQNDHPTTAEQEEFATVSMQSEVSSDAIFNSIFDNVVGVNTEIGIGGTGVFGTLFLQ